METVPPFTIAATEQVFDALFRASALIAKHDQGSTAESAYEAEDAEVNRQISEVGRGLFDPDFVARHLDVGDDWWPDHTRHVDLSIDAFTQAYYDGLRSVLSAAPAGWRIQIVVYGDIRDGETMIGSAAIWADRVLVDRALYGLLVWRGVRLQRGVKPVWRQTDAR